MLDETARRRLREYVKPLAVGVDGATYFGDVERTIAAAELLAQGRADLDADLLYLLALFSGQERWVARMGHRSRTEIFLSSLSVEPRRIQALFRGLARLEREPRSPEEELVHDAVLLEGLGASGIVRSLLEGYRDRLDFEEMASAIEEAAAAPMRTEAGEQLARERRTTMLEFARSLRAERTQLSSQDGRKNI